MKSGLIAHLEKVLLFLLLGSFALPLILSGVLLIPATHTPATAWLRNASLGGVQVQPSSVLLSRASLLSAKYQESVTKRYNFSFAGREFMIRLADEFYLRVFHTSPVGILIGPLLNLNAVPFAQEYCLLRPRKDLLVPLVDDLRRLQDFCDARRIAFAFLITPSKPSISPETLPANWWHRYVPQPREYDYLLPLLREKGIRYVDGHRITADLKRTARAPVFPAGGGHWGYSAALATTNALLELLAREGLGVQPIQHYREEISDNPSGQDYDAVAVLNLMFPMHYPVTNVIVQPLAGQNTHRPNLVFVGGSFVKKMMELLATSAHFSELEYYFYYKMSQSSGTDGEVHRIAAPTPALNFQTDVFAADALVLEANEEVLPAMAPHLQSFLHDALAALPDPHEAKAPFHYLSRTNYRWGDTLSFVANQHPIDTAAISGFSQLTAGGAATEGPLATVRMNVPIPPDDMELEGRCPF
jgi:hypothetical protein